MSENEELCQQDCGNYFKMISINLMPPTLSGKILQENMHYNAQSEILLFITSYQLSDVVGFPHSDTAVFAFLIPTALLSLSMLCIIRMKDYGFCLYLLLLIASL